MPRPRLTKGLTVAAERYLTAPEQLAQWLRNKIADGTYPRGFHIVQLDVIKQYEADGNGKISRMPLRDALRLLEAEGLVKIYPNQGAVVTTLSRAEVHEIYMIRTLLEVKALQLAFEHGPFPADVLAAAEALYLTMQVASASAEWREVDEAFHSVLYQSAQSPRLNSMITALRQQVTRLFFVKQAPDTYREVFQARHREILDACRAHDAAAAVHALQAHLEDSEAVIGAEL